MCPVEMDLNNENRKKAPEQEVHGQQASEPNNVKAAGWCMNEEYSERFPYITEAVKMYHKAKGTNSGKEPNMKEMEGAVRNLMSVNTSLRNRMQNMSAEVKELREFIEAGKHQEELNDFRQARKGVGGRKRKGVDWERFDHLRAGGLTQEEIARVLKMSVSTLKRNMRERNRTAE